MWWLPGLGLTYWLRYGWRWVLLALFGWFGYRYDGWPGVFWALVTVGIIAFVLYTIMDAWHSLIDTFGRR